VSARLSPRATTPLVVLRRWRRREKEEARDHAAALVADAGGDKAGMEAIGGDPRPLQPASKFAREKNVAAHIARVIERLVKTPLMSEEAPFQQALAIGAKLQIGPAISMLTLW